MRQGSLFSGIGGLDLAVEDAMDAATAWQLDLVNAAIRRRHFPDAVQVEADVATVDPNDLEAVDVISAGFSCQDLSCAGPQKGLDEGSRTGPTYRATLRFAGARFVGDEGEFVRDTSRRWLPQFVVGENVPALLSKWQARVERDFWALGYGVTWIPCMALDAGAPHRRARVFFVAERGARGRGVVEVPTDGRWDGSRVPWPTPRASENENRQAKPSPSQLAGTHGWSLNAAAHHPWPTPTASNPNEGEDLAGWVARRDRQKAMQRGIGTPLGIAVALPWATPLVADSEMVKYSGKGGNPSLHTQATSPGEAGRRLSPDWVELLQGLPIGWTNPTGPRLNAEDHQGWPRGWWGPEGSWWPGYDYEPARTYPDHENGGPRIIKGRPARLRGLGNAVVWQQALLALRAWQTPIHQLSMF